MAAAVLRVAGVADLAFNGLAWCCGCCGCSIVLALCGIWLVSLRVACVAGASLSGHLFRPVRVVGVARCAFALVWMGWWVDVFRCACCWSGVGLGVCFVACVAYSAPFYKRCPLRLLRVVLLLCGSFVLRVADPATIRNPATFQ